MHYLTILTLLCNYVTDFLISIPMYCMWNSCIITYVGFFLNLILDSKQLCSDLVYINILGSSLNSFYLCLLKSEITVGITILTIPSQFKLATTFDISLNLTTKRYTFCKCLMPL